MVRVERGFTLVELMVSGYILLVGICGTLLLFVNFMKTTASSWETTIAVSHAEYILEEMQKAPTLFEVMGRDWDEWAQARQLKTLPSEKVQTVYADPAADPLDIRVSVSWAGRGGNSNVALQTMLTK